MDYEEFWESNSRNSFGKGFFFLIHKKKIFNLIKKYKLHGEFLDAGCGDGRLINGQHISGFDISKKAIDLAKMNQGNYFISDIQKKELRLHKKFDLILCSEVLEHVKNYQSAINNLIYYLKKDGYLLLTFPLWQHLWKYYDNKVGHLRRFEPENIVTILTEKGLEVIEFKSYGGLIFRIMENVYHFLGLSNKKGKGKGKEKNNHLFWLFNTLFWLDSLFVKEQKGAQGIILLNNNNN